MNIIDYVGSKADALQLHFYPSIDGQYFLNLPIKPLIPLGVDPLRFKGSLFECNFILNRLMKIGTN
jgi:hypothetical protein